MVGATTWDESCASNWVSGVAATGTFSKPNNTSIPTGSSGIPVNWTAANLCEIVVLANSPDGGTVSGGGVYGNGRWLTTIATPKENYRFVNWTENGIQVSTNSSYYFNVSSI